ncbi:hypothetical protein LIER_27027 [Lithospermum erythrorhizon]|uniref:Uncharacterized protein n=1 Tax=Lithospermum erythrorhizon TaxID=34254 RepID=A0AAV3RER0_LITER
MRMLINLNQTDKGALDGALYRRSFKGPLLKCVSREEGLASIEEILRSGIFWPSIAKDAQDHVRRWDPCQRYASIPYRPPNEMVSVLCRVPFYQWDGGPFEDTWGKKVHHRGS